MTTLCIWIPSLSSPDWYFCNSDFLVLISLFGITIILWISLLYYAHLIFGFEIGLNKQLRFCLALVCTWFLFPDVTVRSDQNGTSRPSPAATEAWAAGSAARIPTAAVTRRHAVRAVDDASDGDALYCCSSASWLRISLCTPGSPTRDPRTPAPTTRAVWRVSRRMQSLPDPMWADLQPPAPDVSHRRSAGSLHHHSANWKS